MADDNIYVRFKGKTLGPLTRQKIQDLARRGQITRMHDLSSDGMSWVKAEEFGDIFTSSRTPKAATPEPTNTPATASPAGGFRSEIAVSSVGQASPRPNEAPDQTVQWYAHVGGENRGPMDAAEIKSLIDGGQIDRETLIWRPGFDDWKPAGDCLSAAFAPAAFSQPESFAASATMPQFAKPTGADLKRNLYYELQRPRPWALMIGGLIALGGLLNAIYWIVVMIVGSNSSLLGSAKVIMGLTGLTVSGIVLTGAYLIYHYANSLKDIAIHREEYRAVEAARRLATLWKFIGISVLTLIVCVVGGALLVNVLAAGVVTGVAEIP